MIATKRCERTSSKFSACSGFRLAPAGSNDIFAARKKVAKDFKGSKPATYVEGRMVVLRSLITCSFRDQINYAFFNCFLCRSLRI